MRTIKEDNILKLRQSGSVTTSDGKNLESVLPFVAPKKPAPAQSVEERTAKAIEDIISKLATALEDNDKNAITLMDMIRKVIIRPDAKIPEFPKMPSFPVPVKKWNFIVERDRLGFIETIRAEAG